MKRNRLTTGTAATILAVALAPALAIAAGKCDAPTSSVDKRACAKAAEGAVALHQFVWRTRMIYALNFTNGNPAKSVPRFVAAR